MVQDDTIRVEVIERNLEGARDLRARTIAALTSRAAGWLTGRALPMGSAAVTEIPAAETR